MIGEIISDATAFAAVDYTLNHKDIRKVMMLTGIISASDLVYLTMIKEKLPEINTEGYSKYVVAGIYKTFGISIITSLVKYLYDYLNKNNLDISYVKILSAIGLSQAAKQTANAIIYGKDNEEESESSWIPDLAGFGSMLFGLPSLVVLVTTFGLGIAMRTISPLPPLPPLAPIG